MSIRQAVESDAEHLCEIAAAMHAESRYSVLPYAPEKIKDLIVRLLGWADGFIYVSCKDGQVVGFLAGYVTEHFASHAKIAGEYGLFISQGHRGGTDAARLIKKYQSWADERGAVLISAGITTGVNTESTSQLYKALGGRQVGVVFELKG